MLELFQNDHIHVGTELQNDKNVGVKDSFSDLKLHKSFQIVFCY